MGSVNINLKQITENAVECFGLTDNHKKKVGALVLIFSNGSKYYESNNEVVCESSYLDDSTKEGSVDDLDDGSLKRLPIPLFEAFRTKLSPSKNSRIQISPKANANPAQWGNCTTQFAYNTEGDVQRNLQTQRSMKIKNCFGSGKKPGAFKILKFGEEQKGLIPRRALSGGKKDSGQNINFHFWLSPRNYTDNKLEPFTESQTSSLSSMIKVVIDKGLEGI